MLLIFSKVLVVFIYIGVGFIANKLKVLPEDSVKHFISLIMGITVPCLMISSITSQDINGSISSQIFKNLRMDMNYHYLMTATQIPGFKKDLGHELDVELTAKIKKDVTLSIGYSTMLGTKTMDYVVSGNHEAWQDWAWLQLNICPKALLSTK